jgi:hypothetical protein
MLGICIGIGVWVLVFGFWVLGFGLMFVGCGMCVMEIYHKLYPPTPIKYPKKVLIQKEDGSRLGYSEFEQGYDEETKQKIISVRVSEETVDEMFGTKREMAYKRLDKEEDEREEEDEEKKIKF